MDMGVLAQIMGGSGAAAIMGQQAPALERQQLLLNDLKQEQLASQEQERRFAAQTQPYTLEKMRLGNEKTGLDNTDQRFKNQVQAELGLEHFVNADKEKLRGSQIKNDKDFYESLGTVATMMETGVSQQEVISHLTSRGMPPQMAAQIGNMSPEQVVEMAHKVQMRGRSAEITMASNKAKAEAALAKAKYEAEERSKRETELQRMRGEQRLAEIGLQNSGALARTLLRALDKNKGDGERIYPKELRTLEERSAFDVLKEKYPEDFKDGWFKGLSKHRAEFNKRRATIADARTKPVLETPDLSALGISSEIAKLMPPNKLPQSISDQLTNVQEEKKAAPPSEGISMDALKKRYPNATEQEIRDAAKENGIKIK